MPAILLNGNEAAALAAKLARVQIFPAYPITPAYPLMECLTRYISAGQLACTFIRVESDHSALAAGVGAALGGARTFTVTNSQGLALMSEVLYNASGLRLPIVMAVVNRALSAPHCRFADHGDSIAQEGSGWIQLYCENTQEILDTCIQAFRIAEDERVRLPVMVNYDGYILSHVKEGVEVPDQREIDSFLPFELSPILDTARPVAVNTATSHEFYTEYKYNQYRAMIAAGPVIEEVACLYGRAFGRDWGGLAEEYRTDGADLVLVAMGSLAGTARVAVDRMRTSGNRVGLLKIRSFRPFPVDAVRALAGRARTVVVLDRNAIPGVGGAVAREIRAALAGRAGAPAVVSVLAGLGGRDVIPSQIEDLTVNVRKALLQGEALPEPAWLGLRN